jgi:hypothetical protein
VRYESWWNHVLYVRVGERGFNSTTSTQLEFCINCQQIFQQKRIKLSSIANTNYPMGFSESNYLFFNSVMNRICKQLEKSLKWTLSVLNTFHTAINKSP